MDASTQQLLIEVLKGRSNSYRMLARLFFKPLSDADLDDLVKADFCARASELDGTGLLAEGFNDMGRALRKRHTGTRSQLATDFTMCFDGMKAIDDLVAVPYASVFLGTEALLYQEPRAEVYKLFQAEGVGLKSGIDLPEDHLSFELEFIALLSDRSAAALDSADTQEALRNLQLARDFIQGSILTWLGQLADRADRILQTRFYRGALKATQGYLDMDLETIVGLIEEISEGDE
ncbi:MAG: molecular chaperone TorD family protein [Coriobacteriales bacterium]|jgi:TorA maturation chaperone TorD|nr:molecular chaperone TorD family protein [Coriobacteriales bacterium]